MFSISSGIPAPSARGRKTKYPWYNMAMGDSFLAHRALRFNIAACMKAISRRTGMKFVMQSVSDNAVRIWRVQ